MNAIEIVNNSVIGQVDINDSDKNLDGSKTFADAKSAIVTAINVIDEALPKMKAAGIDMKKATGDAEGLFRSIVRKGWGGNEMDFYTIRDGNKAIVGINQRTIDDIVNQVRDFVANY